MDYFRKKQTIEDTKTGIDRKTYRLQEEVLARKRNKEYRKGLFWNNVDNHYKKSNALASKYNAWASLPVNSISPEHQRKLEKKNLEERRVKLAQLLACEQEQYRKELKESKLLHKQEEISNFSVLKYRLTDANQKLIQEEEKTRLHAVVLQKYQQCETMASLYQNISDVNVNQKKEERKKDLEMNQERKLQIETKKQNACEEKREVEIKKQEIEQLEGSLLLCMEEMRIKNQTSNALKQEEMRNIELKTKLEEIVINHNFIEEQRRNKTNKPIAKDQYHLQLKQTTKDIQNELEEDKQLMNKIIRCLEQDEIDDVINKETREKVENASVLLSEYTLLEKERERAMEFMFSEEARNMWLNQDIQWDEEKKFRMELIRDILITLQKQIKEKLRQNAECHKNLIEEKDDLLSKIEHISKRLKTHEEETCQN